MEPRIQYVRVSSTSLGRPARWAQRRDDAGERRPGAADGSAAARAAGCAG